MRGVLLKRLFVAVCQLALLCSPTHYRPSFMGVCGRDVHGLSAFMMGEYIVLNADEYCTVHTTTNTTKSFATSKIWYPLARYRIA